MCSHECSAGTHLNFQFHVNKKLRHTTQQSNGLSDYVRCSNPPAQSSTLNPIFLAHVDHWAAPQPHCKRANCCFTLTSSWSHKIVVATLLFGMVEYLLAIVAVCGYVKNVVDKHKTCSGATIILCYCCRWIVVMLQTTTATIPTIATATRLNNNQTDQTDQTTNSQRQQLPTSQWTTNKSNHSQPPSSTAAMALTLESVNWFLQGFHFPFFTWFVSPHPTSYVSVYVCLALTASGIWNGWKLFYIHKTNNHQTSSVAAAATKQP